MRKSQASASQIPISGPKVSAGKRAIILFVNFFLIILAYYHVKPASRSLFIEYLGADQLPYVWIGTALFLGTVIGFYHHLVERYHRLNVVLGTCLLFILLLILFVDLLTGKSATAAVAFYIFVDIFSVVLVEQFWSLTNSVYETEDGKRWYGIVGTGGLLGGVLGGTAASLLLEHTPMHTEQLLYVAAGILGVIFLLNMFMGRVGVYLEAPVSGPKVVAKGGWRTLLQSRYLMLIAAILLFAQLAQPLVEYQFIKTIESTYHELDRRTAFISYFFAVLGLVSIGINLTLTPLIHRYFGAIVGLVLQPIMLLIFSIGFMLQPTLPIASVMKISDRGLSYSINRASKELLYIPIDPIRIYQAKAWIDMLGYRLFKVIGSVLILVLTQWIPLSVGIASLGWLTLACCIIWLVTLIYLAQEYNSLVQKPYEAT